MWLAPVVVFILIRREQARLPTIIGAIVAVAFLLLLSRRPAAAISTLLVLLIFNTFILAGLFKLGLPASIVRPVGYWKEGIVAASLIAVLRSKGWRGRDALDLAAVAYVLLGVGYLLLPKLFVGGAVGGLLPFNTRELGWRSDVFYVLIFLIFRHLRLGRDVVDKILSEVFLVAVVAAVIGTFEFSAPGTWNHIAVKTFGVQQYKVAVLHQIPGGSFNLQDVRVYGSVGGHKFVRIGSVLLDYLGVGYIFALGLGIAAERIARAQARISTYVALPVLGIALLLTQTRSAIIAGGVAVLVALRAQVGQTVASRARLALVIGAAAIVAAPLVLATGALHRFSGDKGSDSAHTSAFHAGIHAMAIDPLGRGLATAAGGGQIAAQRQGGAAANVVLVTESQYLEIGTQLGDIGLAIYVLLIVLIVRHLLRRTPQGRAPPLAPAAMTNAFLGAVIGSIFLQPFTGLQVAWIFWGLAGLAAGVVDQERKPAGQTDNHGFLPPWYETDLSRPLPSEATRTD